MNKKKTGILLSNIGSPNKLDLQEIKIYLKKFLSDPKVVNLPYLFRKILVNGIIVPFRSKNTFAAYKEIWTDKGSPLILHSQNFKDELNKIIGDDFVVEVGMSYSLPTIQNAIDSLVFKANCTEIILIPMYPQYAESTTESSIEIVKSYLSKNKISIKLKILPYFYNNKYYIKAMYELIKQELTKINKFDLVLFSYHGLPEKQVKKFHGNNFSCNMTRECRQIFDKNNLCYRAQCFQTTREIVSLLELPQYKYATSFQSRLGRIPWIKPYTEEILVELIQKGIKDLVVVCPSFVADCLETLEEIGMRAKETWFNLGGNSFHLIPCLNTNKLWLEFFKKMVMNQAI